MLIIYIIHICIFNFFFTKHPKRLSSPGYLSSIEMNGDWQTSCESNRWLRRVSLTSSSSTGTGCCQGIRCQRSASVGKENIDPELFSSTTSTSSISTSSSSNHPGPSSSPPTPATPVKEPALPSSAADLQNN